MGGKQKQGQRTKGNARPSSSIRSAERLVAAGAGPLGSLSGLVGGAAQATAYLGLVKPKAAAGDEEVDSFLDGDCRMLMKKMTKKDAITRLKALQEFKNLCDSCDEDLLKGALPFWPRHFNRLSQDSDRRVREVTHTTNSLIVSRMKKNLAPHLKAIMGNWLICLSDPHGPAASAAQSAFDSAFAPPKQLDVLLFCKDEILSLISENLFQQTASDLVPTEDVEGAQNRIVATSLLALATFLERVPREEHDKLSETFDRLFDHKTFWTFPQSQVPMIRKGWFSAMSAACVALPILIERRAKKVVTVVLGSLNETNPVVVGAVFEAALHLVVALENCWTHVSASKTVMPKVWCSLRRGGEGNATIIGPYLLPFISKVPKDSFATDLLLYEEFFNNCRKGMDLPQVKSSPSEHYALMKAYIEILTYATKQFSLEALDSRDWADFLIQQLLPVIEAGLTEADSKIANASFNLVGDYLNYVCGGATSTSSSPPAVGFFKTLQSALWEIIAERGRSLLAINTTESSNRFSLLRLSGLCRCPLQHNSKMRASRRVCFREENAAGPGEIGIIDQPTAGNTSTAVCESTLDATIPTGSALSETVPTGSGNNLSSHRALANLDSPLVALATELCVAALDVYLDNKSATHIQFFAEMLRAFASDHLFASLLAHFIQGRSEVEADDNLSAIAAWRFYVAVVEDAVVAERNRKSVGYLLDVVFCVLESVGRDDRHQLIRRLVRAGDVYVLDVVLARLMATGGDDWAARYLSGPDVREAVTTTASRLLLPSATQVQPWSESDRLTGWNVLSVCLSAGEADRFLTPECVEALLKVVLASLRQCRNDGRASDQHLDRLIDNIFRNAPWCWTLATCQQVLLEYFIVDCATVVATAVEPDQVVTPSTVRKIWTDGLVSLVGSQGGLVMPGGFLHEAATYVHQSLATESVISLARQQHLAGMMMELLATVNRLLPVSSSGLSDNVSVAELVSLVLPTESEWDDMLSRLWSTVRAGELLVGRLYHPTLDPSIEDSNLVSVNPLAFAATAAGLLVFLFNGECSEVEEFGLGKEIMWRHVRAVFECVTYASYAESFVKDFGQSEVEKCAATYFSPTLEQLRLLLSGVSPNNMSILASRFYRFALEDDSFASAYVLRKVLSMMNDAERLVDANAFLKVDFVPLPSSSPGALHVFQLLMSESAAAGLYLLEELMLTWRPSVTMLDEDGVYVSALAICFAALPDQQAGCDSPVLEHAVSQIMDAVIAWKEQLNSRPNNENEVVINDWNTVSKVIQVLRLLTALVDRCSQLLTQPHWDFILCALGSWVQAIEKSKASLEDNFTLQMMACSTFELVAAVAARMEAWGALDVDTRPCPANLITEWCEFFSAEIYGPLLNLFCQRAAACRSLPRHNAFWLQALVVALQYVVPSVVETNSLEVQLSADWDSGDAVTPDRVKTALNLLCPLVLSPVRDVRLGAFTVLRNCAAMLVAYEELKMSSSRPADPESQLAEQQVEESSRPLPGALLAELMRSAAACEPLLRGADLCGTLDVEPDSDSFATISGYLLTWRLALNLFGRASPELRSLLAGHLRETGLLVALVNNLFRLMPKKAAPVFTEHLTLDARAPPSSNEVAHLACYVYLEALGTMPALVREWWNALDKRHSQHVDKFTTQYVSPLLVNRDVRSVQRTNKKLLNMLVRARPTAREVVATYSVEEISFELVVKLSINHPLGVVSIETGKRVGVSASQWSYWLLQLRTFLMNQNGSILDGLELWKQNIDKKFEGIQECYVCYYVLHGTTCQLPRLMCRTCKKKFHSACLYKWFNTSRHSTCPLCRSIF